MTEYAADEKPLALIIEDDYDARMIFAAALAAAGYETEIIQDGNTALVRLSELTPAMIVLDLHLPHTSGRDILQYIRTNKQFAKTRVMLATADALLAESLRGQVDLVLLKPIDFRQLRDLSARLRPPDIVLKD